MNKKLSSIIVYLFALVLGCYAIAVAAMFGVPIIAAEIFIPLWVVITTYLFHLFLPFDKKKCIVAPLIAAFIVGAACNAVLWFFYEAGTRPVSMVACVIAALFTMLFTRGAKQKPHGSVADMLCDVLPEKSNVYVNITLPDSQLDPEYPVRADYVISRGMNVYVLFLDDGRDRGIYTGKEADAANIFALALQSHLEPLFEHVVVTGAAFKPEGPGGEHVVCLWDLFGILSNVPTGQEEKSETDLNNWLKNNAAPTQLLCG